MVVKNNYILLESVFVYSAGGFFELILSDKQRFPDSLFSATASSEYHSAAEARVSSNSSWCAPYADRKRHYLQVDLKRLYRLDYLVTYGDTNSKNWVATYELKFTIDLINWKTISKLCFRTSQQTSR